MFFKSRTHLHSSSSKAEHNVLNSHILIKKDIYTSLWCSVLSIRYWEGFRICRYVLLYPIHRMNMYQYLCKIPSLRKHRISFWRFFMDPIYMDPIHSFTVDRKKIIKLQIWQRWFGFLKVKYAFKWSLLYCIPLFLTKTHSNVNIHTHQEHILFFYKSSLEKNFNNIIFETRIFL